MGAPDEWSGLAQADVPDGYKVVWNPTTKQAEFLSAAEFEVLYGGAAGGGKTDGLLIDALGLDQEGYLNSSYQAIIFRRTFPDLRDIIDRSEEIYHDFCPMAKYDKQEHVWTFYKEDGSPGGKVEFGYIQRDVERYRYRGRAFAYIGWEELTLWPTSKPYDYLMSRCRVPVSSGLKTYVRATSNPDGPGYKWVKDHWGIQTTGEAVNRVVQVTDDVTGKTYERSRRFIPAKVEDNPHIGEDYLITLSGMDDDEKNALRKGLWLPPKIKGAYYAEDVHDARKAGRICKVPYIKSEPVYTFWDLGVSKNGTTAIWAAQFIAGQARWLTCYENYDQPLSHYVTWLNECGYAYGTHYLPHDAQHRRLGQNDVDSWQEMLQELTPNTKVDVVERTDDVYKGISMTRDKFEEVVFDEDKCAEGIAALENYRRIWDAEQQVFRNKPLHDWCSNYADAFRQWGQLESTPSGRRKKFNRKKHQTNHRTV